MNALWQKVNREMVAKILAELEYERTLRAEPVSSDGWRIAMGNESWQFRAARGIWGWLHIDPDSLIAASGDAVEAESALLQLATVLEMSDAQTAEHMEDLYATLRGDMQLLQAREALDADALIHLDPDEFYFQQRSPRLGPGRAASVRARVSRTFSPALGRRSAGASGLEQRRRLRDQRSAGERHGQRRARPL